MERLRQTPEPGSPPTGGPRSLDESHARGPGPGDGDPSPELIVTLQIDDLAFGGEGLGRLDGKVRFVPGALPGERVRARRLGRRRSFDRMQLVEVLDRSPDRLRPLCPHSDYCGGCATQPLRYERQLEAKARQVRDCLARIGSMDVPEVGPPLPAPRLSGYRNKMDFTFGGRAWSPAGPPETPRAPALGLHVPGRFDAIFDVEHCILPGGRAVTALQVVRDYARRHGLTGYRSRPDEGLLRHLIVREGKNTGDFLLGLVTRTADPPLPGLAEELAARVPGLTGVVRIVNDRRATIARGTQSEVLFGRDTFRERLLRLEFELGAQSFFQTNTWGAEVLVSELRRLLADLPGRRILDLYCGVGTLGLSLADRFEQVHGVELADEAVADAQRNARRNGIAHATFVAGDVDAWLREPPEHLRGIDGVIVDPPRAGLHPRTLQSLPRLGASWIAYVSCNPSTLARDAAGLRDAGYLPTRLRVIDLFPHTAHVESILVAQNCGAR